MATNANLNETDLESFRLIWLDAGINKPENEETQNDFRQLSEQFQGFENSDDCLLHIQTLSIDERIVLIVSGRLGRDIVPKIHQYEQIGSIYVYCFHKEENEKWAKNYSKIKNVLTEQAALIEQIRQDNQREIDPIDHDLLYIHTYQQNSPDQFVNSQLLIDHLLHMNMPSTTNTDLFTSNSTEFSPAFQDDYSSDDSLWWLTKEKYCSQLISQSFQEKTLDLLYSLRSYLRDIHQQLQIHQCTTPIHVYHAHLITHEEMEQFKNSIGKLISINTFFVATVQRSQALLSTSQTTDLQKIVLEIDADPTIDGKKPFANIGSFSYSNKSSEIMFMFGSIFRIENVFQENNVWICQMNLSSTNAVELKTIFEQMKKEDGDSKTDPLAFGNFLTRLNQYDDAEKYYLKISKELPSNHQDIYICYQNLGNVAYLKKDYDKSIQYHLKSLEIKQILFKSDDPHIADSYNCLGNVYYSQQNYQQAIDFHEKGLQILEPNLAEHHSQIIVYLSNLSSIYRMENNYSKALDCYQKMFDIEKQYLTEDHPDLGQTYHNIGACHWCLGSLDAARKYYTLSLEIKDRHLPSRHPSIAMTLENLGLIHENKNEFQTAFEYYRKAADIYQQTLSITHSDVIQIKENILRVSSHLKQK